MNASDTVNNAKARMQQSDFIPLTRKSSIVIVLVQNCCLKMLLKIGFNFPFVRLPPSVDGVRRPPAAGEKSEEQIMAAVDAQEAPNVLQE